MEIIMTTTVVTHDITSSDAQAMQAMRAAFEGTPRITFAPASRAAFDGIMGQTPAPDDVDVEQGEVGGVAGWWCRPRNAGAASVILYLHGGGYVIGSAGAYRHFVGRSPNVPAPRPLSPTMRSLRSDRSPPPMMTSRRSTRDCWHSVTSGSPWSATLPAPV
jgi:hypothetical protein